MPDIEHQLKIGAPPQRVYEALTTAEGIRRWWTTDAKLSSEVGGKGEFRFLGGDVVLTMRIEELRSPVRVVWQTIASTVPYQVPGTRVSFDLSADGEGTALSFAHRGFERAEEGWEKVKAGWAYYLESLRLYLETGAGTPR